MEFTILVLLAVSILLILLKPQKEKLIFSIFLVGACLNYFMYLVASFDSIIPSGNW